MKVIYKKSFDSSNKWIPIKWATGYVFVWFCSLYLCLSLSVVQLFRMRAWKHTYTPCDWYLHLWCDTMHQNTFRLRDTLVIIFIINFILRVAPFTFARCTIFLSVIGSVRFGSVSSFCVFNAHMYHFMHVMCVCLCYFPPAGSATFKLCLDVDLSYSFIHNVPCISW